jgi:hypothetical protein
MFLEDKVGFKGDGIVTLQENVILVTAKIPQEVLNFAKK